MADKWKMASEQRTEQMNSQKKSGNPFLMQETICKAATGPPVIAEEYIRTPRGFCREAGINRSGNTVIIVF